MKKIMALLLLLAFAVPCFAGNLGHQKPIRKVLLMKAPVADEVYIRDAIDGVWYRIVACDEDQNIIYDEAGNPLNGMKQTEINSIISRPKVRLKVYKLKVDR